MIYMTGGIAYALVHDYKNGWNPEAFRERFSEVLERYDYVVGDWGYNQLRLKGFFREAQPKSPKDAVITSLIDYVNEYCNFGCAYFVLEKLDPSSIPEDAVIFSSPAPAEPAAEAAEASEDPEAEDAPAAAAALHSNPSAPLMRWPLKERPGGRVPGTSPSAVARAVSEGAERRAAAAAQAGGGSRLDSSFGRGYPDGNGGGNRPKSGGSDSNGRDRRSGGNQGHHGHQGHSHNNNHNASRQGHTSSGGGSERRQHGQDRKQGGGGGGHRRSHHSGAHSSGKDKDHHERDTGAGAEARATIAAGAEGEQANRSSGGGGGRWAGKNRRRGGFHGKPNRPRHEGAPRSGGGHRPEAGAGHGGGDRS